MDKLYDVPRGRLLPTLVIFLFVLGLLYTLFLVFQKINLNGDITHLQAESEGVQGKIEALKEDQIEELVVAEDLKKRIEEIQILWSKVLSSVENLTPVGVFFSSYTVGEDRSIQLSGLGNDFGAVASVISSLQKSADFTDVFVPSITLGKTSDGQSVVSFSLQLTTLEE